MDELARDIEKLLDRAAPGLEGAVRTTELRLYLISALPERISFQLKLLPKVSYRETIAKAKELCLMFSRADQTKMEQASQLSGPTDRLNKLEEAVHKSLNRWRLWGRILMEATTKDLETKSSATTVADEATWHATVGTLIRETTKGAPQNFEHGVFPATSRCSTNSDSACTVSQTSSDTKLHTHKDQ